MASDEKLTSARLIAEGSTEAARRSINVWGRDGVPVLEQIRRDLVDLAENVAERCDGEWILHRREIAEAIIAQAKRLDAHQGGKK